MIRGTGELEGRVRAIDTARLGTPQKMALKVGVMVIREVNIDDVVRPELEAVFADVLEHLADPWSCVDLAQQVLPAEEGRVHVPDPHQIFGGHLIGGNVQHFALAPFAVDGLHVRNVELVFVGQFHHGPGHQVGFHGGAGGVGNQQKMQVDGQFGGAAGPTGAISGIGPTGTAGFASTLRSPLAAAISTFTRRSASSTAKSISGEK